MQPKELRRIGRKLYGEDWQSPLARRLKRHRTTVWRWVSGAVPIPKELAKEIRRLGTNQVPAH